MTTTLMLGDCLDRMGEIAAGSVDLILADLPYGTTACKWDVVIPFEPLWAHYRRILKPRGAVVLTASQPFNYDLIASNRNWFRWADIWDKVTPRGHLNARKRPLAVHEDVCVFSPVPIGSFTYNPQMRTGKFVQKGGKRRKNQCYGSHKSSPVFNDQYYPTSIIRISRGSQYHLVHPTQKPVALGRYLIRTYSNPGEVVLDNAAGSGSFLVAAIEEGRDAIGIERDPEYHAIAEARLAAALKPAEVA